MGIFQCTSLASGEGKVVWRHGSNRQLKAELLRPHTEQGVKGWQKAKLWKEGSGARLGECRSQLKIS